MTATATRSTFVTVVDMSASMVAIFALGSVIAIAFADLHDGIAKRRSRAIAAEFGAPA